jgi:hypothetical protein
MGLGLILLFAAFLAAGCLTDPEKKETPTEEPAQFRDLTSREDVIYNLLLSYQEKNISQYSRLLLEDDDSYNGSDYQAGYYWYNQPESEGLDEYMLRDADIASTNNLFLAAMGTPSESQHPEIYRLSLMISEGTWSQVTELFGQTCEDCWFTEREYEIRLDLGEDAVMGLNNIQLYIVPVDEGDVKIYKIAVAKDVRSE